MGSERILQAQQEQGRCRTAMCLHSRHAETITVSLVIFWDMLTLTELPKVFWACQKRSFGYPRISLGPAEQVQQGCAAGSALRVCSSTPSSSSSSSSSSLQPALLSFCPNVERQEQALAALHAANPHAHRDLKLCIALEPWR